jgi:nucleoside-diphosphate-sugar epimerase
MKKILITGASGFIGSFLVEKALKQGCEVFAGIRSSSDLSNLRHPEIKLFTLDLFDKSRLRRSFRDNPKFDFIIHNAGVTKSLDKNEFERVNFQCTKNMIEALIETNRVPEKFVFMSSLAAIGPGDEKSMLPIKESDMPRPNSLYGKSKLKAENFIRSIEGFPYLIIRPTGVYGPREKDYLVMYKMINQHLETYIGSANQGITFIYVKDLASLIFKVLETNKIRKSYFLTDGHHYTTQVFSAIVKAELQRKTLRMVFPKGIVRPLAWLSEMLGHLTGNVPTLNTEKFKEISCKNWLCDNNEIVKDSGFTPEYNLAAGLRITIFWCKQNKLF